MICPVCPGRYCNVIFYHSKILCLLVFPLHDSFLFLFSLHLLLLLLLAMSSKEITAKWEKGSVYSDPREEYSKVEANARMEIEEGRSGCFDYCSFPRQSRKIRSEELNDEVENRRTVVQRPRITPAVKSRS